MIFILLQKRKNPTVVGAGDLCISGIRLKIPICSYLLLWLSQNQLANECHSSGNSRYGVCVGAGQPLYNNFEQSIDFFPIISLFPLVASTYILYINGSSVNHNFRCSEVTECYTCLFFKCYISLS